MKKVLLSTFLGPNEKMTCHLVIFFLLGIDRNNTILKTRRFGQNYVVLA
jgi:hypothetical protein